MIGEMHCHTHYSRPKWIHRQLPTPFELVDRACSLGLDFVAIADHDSQAAFPIVNEYALSKGLVVIPSVEISAKSSKLPHKRPHILAYGVIDIIPSRRSIPTTINAIHAQGGIAVAAHPYCVKYSKAMFVGDSVQQYGFDGIEVFNSSEPIRSNLQALALAEEQGCLQFAGSDAHTLDHLGKARVEIDIDACLDWRELVALLKEGRYRIISSDFISEHIAFQPPHSSSLSFILHSLRGRAS